MRSELGLGNNYWEKTFNLNEKGTKFISYWNSGNPYSLQVTLYFIGTKVTNQKITAAVQAYVDAERTVLATIPSEYGGKINQTAILESIQILGKLP